MSPPLSASIFLESASILAHQAFPGDQYQLSLAAPRCAQTAQPGQFVHLQCHPLRPLRRPISLLACDAEAGRVELLYKAVGAGTRLLAGRRPGETVSVLGPIGVPFRLNPERSRPLLIGGGVGLPPMVFLAQSLRAQPHYQPLVLLGSEVPFPFSPRPSQMPTPGLPDGVITCHPLLDDWHIPSRLASLRGLAGCFEGYVTALAHHWLVSLDTETRATVEIFACGPHPMLEAAARLAQSFGVPGQLSLEEYMACGVGGCAGCTVFLMTPAGPAMKRVCVDGPVFDATQVFPGV